ncbi:MAG: hypothetical protein ACR2NX_02115 [Chthoniobacterales bacterium]
MSNAKKFQAEYYEQLAKRNECKNHWCTATGARCLLQSFDAGQPPARGTLDDAYSWLVELWENSRHDKGDSPRTFGNGISRENWLLKRKHFPSDGKSLSRELKVETAIAQALEPCARNPKPRNGHAVAFSCGNSVATTSGLLGKTRGARRGFLQIDIVRLCDAEHGELIELKYLTKSEKPKNGLGLVVGAAFQAALYALTLILWHAKEKTLVGSCHSYFKERPALTLPHWRIKTMANQRCFDGQDRRLLGQFSSWLAAELNSVANEYPSEFLGGPLKFWHSFHTYPDAWSSSIPKSEVFETLTRRWDETPEGPRDLPDLANVTST